MARKLDSAADRQRQLSDRGESEGGRRSRDRETAVSRRAFVRRGVTATLGLSATAGTVRTTSAERAGIRFHRVLDAVTDLGMDPGGDDPVGGAIATADDGTLIQFPDGTYRFGSDGGVELDGRVRGFEGRGDDVTLLAPEGYGGLFFAGDEMAGAFVGNVDIDQTARGASAGIRLRGDRLVVRDVVVRGAAGGRGSDTTALSCSTERKRGSLLVENVATSTDGGHGADRDRHDGVTRPAESVRTPRGASASSDASGPDRLRIEGAGVATNYEITVDGSIEREQSEFGYSRSGSNSEGTVETGAIRYVVDGTITDFRLNGRADIYLNSTKVDPAVLGRTHHHRLALGADGSTTACALSVGQLHPSDEADSAKRRERCESTDATEGVDTYRFAGDVGTLAVRGSATLSFGIGRY